MIGGKQKPEQATDVAAIKKRIEDKDIRSTLVSVLDANEEFLTELVGEEILDDSAKDEILAGPTRTEVNKRVLKWLSNTDDVSTFKTFLAKLRQHGQDHVANFIDGTPGELPLTTKRRQSIQKIMVDLTKKIDPDSGLLESLVSDDVISETSYEEIKEQNKTSRTKTLLNILLRGSDKAFDKFLDELMKNQPQAMDIINEQVGETTKPHVEILKANHMVLIRCTDISLLTIAILRSEAVIDGDMEDALKALTSGRQKLMYNWLEHKSALVYQAFIKTMQDNEQNHVANLLGKNLDGQQPMSLEKFDRLIRQRPHLMKGIFSNGTELASALVSRKASDDTDSAISKTDYEDITQGEKTTTARNSVLIDAILRRTDFSYDSLEIALRQTKQDHWADLLIEGEVVGAHINTTRPDREGDLSNAWNDHIVDPKKYEENIDLQKCMNKLESLHLPTVATEAGHSIMVYTYCKTPEDMRHYVKLLNSRQLQDIFENILNHLLRKLEGESFQPLEAAVMLEEEDKMLVQRFTGLDGNEDDLKNLPFISSETCISHGNPRNIYCFGCKTVICSSCVDQDHKFHEHSDVCKTPDSLRKQLQEDLALISSCKASSLKRKEMIENGHMQLIKRVEESEKAVVSRCEDLKHRVERFKETLLQERATYKQQILHDLDNRMRAIESSVAVFKDYEEYTKNLMERGSPSDICQSFTYLHDRAIKLQQVYEPVPDKSVSEKNYELMNQMPCLTPEQIGVNPTVELTKVLPQGMLQPKSNPIERFRQFLEEFMDPCFGLLEELSLPSKVKKEVLKVKSERRPQKKNAKILDYILRNEKYMELITALKNSNQTHIVNFLNSDGVYDPKFGADWPLKDTNQIQILEANRKYLVEYLHLHPLLEILHAAKVISTKQKDFIFEKRIGLHDKNEALLGMLKCGSLDNYRRTVECLCLSNQSEIAQLLGQGVAQQSQVNVIFQVQTTVDKEVMELRNSFNQLITSERLR